MEQDIIGDFDDGQVEIEGKGSGYDEQATTPYNRHRNSNSAPSHPLSTSTSQHSQPEKETPYTMGVSSDYHPSTQPKPRSIHSQLTSTSYSSYISPFGTDPVGVIGIHKPREIIRVERDYSIGGEGCQFWSGWIMELEGRITPTEFQNTLNEFNQVLGSAHDPYKSCCDNCVAVLTFYLSPLVFGSHYDREMKRFTKLIDRANRELYNPAGLNILNPRKSAFLFLEIEYY